MSSEIRSADSRPLPPPFSPIAHLLSLSIAPGGGGWWGGDHESEYRHIIVVPQIHLSPPALPVFSWRPPWKNSCSHSSWRKQSPWQQEGLCPQIAGPGTCSHGSWPGTCAFKEQVIWVCPAGMEVGPCVLASVTHSMASLGTGGYPSVGPPPAQGGRRQGGKCQDEAH